MFSIERWKAVLWREHVWKDAAEMIFDRPLFGHGPNSFMSMFEYYRKDSTGDPTYAHNCYLQMACEVGLLGLGAFLWMIASIFDQSLLAIRNKIDQFLIQEAEILGLLCALLAFLVQSFFDTNFYSLQLSVLLWVMIGILMAYINIVKQHINSREYETK